MFVLLKVPLSDISQSLLQLKHRELAVVITPMGHEDAVFLFTVDALKIGWVRFLVLPVRSGV